jgi:predicted metal-dependent phosphotriesterase family hydrolase
LPSHKIFLEKRARALYMKNVVYPQLEEMGVSSADRESLFTDNPKRFFEGQS